MARAEATRKRRRKTKRRKTTCRKPRKRRRARSSEVRALESRRRRKACRPKKRKPRKPKPKATAPKRPKAPVAVPPRQPVPPKPKPKPAAPVTLASPVAKYTGTFGVPQAERLLWRAGFGPSPGHAAALAKLGLQGAVASLSRPTGTPTLTGAAPKTQDGDPLTPEDSWGHDHLWFLDRMVRTSQPLIERMTLIWHDWFATSNDSVGSQKLMLVQNALFRRSAFGSFKQLLLDVTADPAMLLWLNGTDNNKWNPNENYGREVQELFTLGADRGAYTEDDVREMARALTGWRNDWSAELGNHNFRFDASWHDTHAKTIHGHTGNYDWKDACSLCVGHPLHPSFFVEKLWSYFIPTPPSGSDRQKLEAAYVGSGYAVRPIVEAILMHPDLHTGPRMVKPPVVYAAGLLRGLRRAIDTEAWVWLADPTGQRLFYPPNVSGWDDARWLDTSTVRGRWLMAAYALNGRHIQNGDLNAYPDTETPEQAVAAARAYWADPGLTPETVSSLTAFASSCLPAVMANWEKHQYRGLRQNALRQLIATSPDLQTS